MSAYENVVGGKLKLKGEALSVKEEGVKKKKKNHENRHSSLCTPSELSTGANAALSMFQEDDGMENEKDAKSEASRNNDRLTPAERRYLQQIQKLELQRLEKMARKSHRDRIQEFNQYLANLTEHYDIPKVGPG